MKDWVFTIKVWWSVKPSWWISLLWSEMSSWEGLGQGEWPTTRGGKGCLATATQTYPMFSSAYLHLFWGHIKLLSNLLSHRTNAFIWVTLEKREFMADVWDICSYQRVKQLMLTLSLNSCFGWSRETVRFKGCPWKLAPCGGSWRGMLYDSSTILM